MNLTIGEVEKQTGCKAHTIRYWEQLIPLIQPQKDVHGYRLYSSRDVALIKRIKELVQEQKYSIEGATEQLYRELTGEHVHTSNPQGIRKQTQSLVALRSELERLLEIVHNDKERDSKDKVPHDGKE